MQKRRELDSLFRILGNRRRRELIARLHEKREVTVGVSDRERRIEMAHTHLPKLEDRQLIEYERMGNVVRVNRGERWGEIEEVVEPLLETGVLS